MASKKNRFGLSRKIPESIKRQIRQRSKFGCVVCRAGVSHYEHISPEFKDAKSHDPENICCLCGACHDKVNRKIFSKDFIAHKYSEIQKSINKESPHDFFDMHTGEAQLLFGGQINEFTPNFVFSVYGKSVFQVVSCPGQGEGAIYAYFTNGKGQEVMRIDGNQWIAFDKAWDVNVVGQRITVSSDKNTTALKLRAEPPGRIIIEHLDMCYGAAHLMATEHNILLGHYINDQLCAWLTASLVVTYSSKSSIFLSVHEPESRKISIGTDDGVAWPEAGISIANKCGFKISECIMTIKSIEHVRKYFFKVASQPGLPKLINGTHFLLLEDECYNNNDKVK
jgi:hypothetical protein